jgi:hypothetical protein
MNRLALPLAPLSRGAILLRIHYVPSLVQLLLECESRQALDVVREEAIRRDEEGSY